MTNDDFITLARSIHGNKYDYSKTVFSGYGKNKNIIITCPKHGDFTQTATRHIHDKRGCRACGYNIPTTEEFINQCRTIHGDRYDYGQVVVSRLTQKVLVGCPDHGIFGIKAQEHLAGVGCGKCAGKHFTREDFTGKAISIHGNKYLYDRVDYTTSHKKVVITCPSHGDFTQTPNGHLNGNGCKECHNDWLRSNALGSYNDAFIRLYPEKAARPAVVYFVRLHNGTEDFVKVGITVRGTKKRFESLVGYTMEVLGEKEMTLEQAIYTERNLKKKWGVFSYTPLVGFNGKTECFTYQPEMLAFFA